MAKVSYDISDLKKLLGDDLPPSAHAERSPNEKIKDYGTKQTGSSHCLDNDVLHSYIRSVVNDSGVYDIMKDTEVDGVSFRALSESCSEELSKDIVDFFACCFFEGDYSQLDTLAMQCEEGNRKTPYAKSSILGHVVDMTYFQEFGLLTKLFAVAVAIDKQMDENCEDVCFSYNPSDSCISNNDNKDDNLDHNYVLVYNSRLNEVQKIASSPIKKVIRTNGSNPEKKPQTQKKIANKSKLKKAKQRTVAHHGIVSTHSFKRRSFASHIANSGVWGKIADYGGFNGRLIYINAGHGR